MLTDTHAHLDFPQFQDDIASVLSRAAEAGVTRIITVGTGIESSRQALGLSEKWPQVWAATGVHPNHVPEERADFLPSLRELAAHPRVAAIGETGLDYFRLAKDDDASRIAQAAAYLCIAGGFDGFYARVMTLRTALNIPANLTAMGVEPARLDELTAMAMEDPSCGGNPVPMTLQNTRALFEACL